MSIFYAGEARIAGIELGIQLEISSESLMNVNWKPGDSGLRPKAAQPSSLNSVFCWKVCWNPAENIWRSSWIYKFNRRYYIF
jgi:hypothetical protein